jgi:ribonuclease HII
MQGELSCYKLHLSPGDGYGSSHVGVAMPVSRMLPSLRVEGRYFADGCSAVAGMDEVGRGAWAGPVSIGIAVVTPGCGRRIPKGVRDSKQLLWPEREALFAPLARSLASWAVGHASNEECDELGMTVAQRLAAKRALDQLEVAPDVVLLDGRFDFLADRIAGVSDFPPVRLIVRGDASAKSISAASVLAKVTRDRLMALEAQHYPWYGFERNRGYPSPVHKMALASWGCTPFHRRSWAFVGGLMYRPEGWEELLARRGLLREPEYALGDDVAHDLVGPPGDAHAWDSEEELRPGVGAPLA